MLSYVLIRKTNNTFMDFLKIPNLKYFSFQLFICQYHIWLAADTRGILVLIPGNPMLNIIVSTFIFVCVAHEISQITNDLAQIIIPKDNSSLLKRLACIAAFFCGLLILSSIQDKSRHQDSKNLKLFRLTLNLPRGEQHLSGDVL